MQMVSGFMEKMGGKEACMQMKHDWCKTMKDGTEEEKQEQWKKFGEKMSQFGEHAKEFKPDFEGECEGKPWGKMWGGGKFGGGKVLREGMGQQTGINAAGALDYVITNALIIDAKAGIVKADIGIKGSNLVIDNWLLWFRVFSGVGNN